MVRLSVSGYMISHDVNRRIKNQEYICVGLWSARGGGAQLISK